jgi:soluble lytic murein transglycosylase-like protein
MHQKFPQAPAVLRVFALVLTCFFCAAAATAQEKAMTIESAAQPEAVAKTGNPSTVVAGIPSSDTPASKKAAPAATTAATPKSTDNTTEVSDYKKSLIDLKTLYERQAQRLEQENSQAKELYRDGLIARVEMEKSDKELADARAKVEETGNQIAVADKPAPIMPATQVNSVLSDVAWSTGNNRVDTLVRFYGNKYGVDPYLIYCLMSQESGFTSSATSPKGAQGLMQLMPGTAARYGVTNPYDVSQSIMGGTRYLKDLLEMFNGRIDLALAGYNAGEGAVIKYRYSVPPYQETRNYVRLISARYAKRPVQSLTKPA